MFQPGSYEYLFVASRFIMTCAMGHGNHEMILEFHNPLGTA